MKRFLALLAVLCLSLCGCDNITPVQTDEKEILDVFSQFDDENEPSAYPVSINDAYIEKAPEKVVCLSQSLADIIAEMGYGATIKGIGSYCTAPEGVTSPEDIGRPTQPDIDKMIALSPDVLFTSTAVPSKDVMTLAEHGVKTVYIPYPHSVEEFGRIYDAVGMVYCGMFDGEKEGQKAFEPITAAFEKARSYEIGTFVYITEGYAAAGEATFENSVLSLFGTSVASSNAIYGYSIDLGFLSENEPDVVFLNDGLNIDDIASVEALSSLKAVTDGRVILVDNSYFENPSKDIIKLIDDISEKLANISTEKGTE